jgi:aryl-alcohol dehydrogenase-like predicted oxidoreductase
MKLKKLVIGTAQFGVNYGIANTVGKVEETEVFKILNFAYKKGVFNIDTAIAYGKSEEIIGQYLKKYSNEKWCIVTKIKSPSDYLHDQVNQSIHSIGSIPDVVLAHSAADYLAPSFCKELHQLKEKKSIKQVGVSLYNEDEIIQVMESDFKPDVIQLPLNILDTKLYRNETLAELNNEGIEIHVRSAFLQGLFYLPEVDLKEKFSDAVPYVKILISIAAEIGLTLAELSLLWLLSLEEVSKVVLGVDSKDQLTAHLKTLTKKVDPAVFEEALCIHYENENILNPSLWL